VRPANDDKDQSCHQRRQRHSEKNKYDGREREIAFSVNGHPIKIITLSTINTIHPTSSHFMAIMALAARIRPGLIVWIMVAVNPFPSPIPEAMPKNTQNPDQTNSIPWAIRRIQIF